MTVSYQYDVASSTSGGFIRLLFRWRGSVWKLVYRELLVFTIAYFLLTMMYRYVFTELQKRIFERIVFFCSTFMDLIPLSFVLGFYVSFIATRWWNQYIAIPWPDKLMNSISLYIPGMDETSRVLRRTLMRYLNVALVLVLRSISMAVKRRFPTREHLVDAGFMTKNELDMLQSVPSTEFNTFWIPCTWFINLLREARQECHITDSNGLKLIMEEFNEFRSKCGMLWSYDWISIPLVYTQVVTLATYTFFGACIFGRQYVDDNSDTTPASHKIDFYIPVFTIFQLFFYMGLLKVAEQLINPFGDDDEDFELNWIIDRHMKVSYLGVDLLNTNPPPLVRDNYFYQEDMKLPYTEASVGYKKKTYRGSVARMQIPQEKQNLVVPEFLEDDDEDRIAETYGMGKRGASLWTLVGGKLNTRFSVSNQNLDAVSLESGSNNWKVSNPSLFAFPSEEGFIEDMANEGSLTLAKADATAETQDQQQSKAPTAERRKSIIPLTKKKPAKRFAVFLPHLKRKGGRSPHNKWIAFQSAAPQYDGPEPLTLLHKTTTEPRIDVPEEGSLPFTTADPVSCSTGNRRKSFDERNAIQFTRSHEFSSPRFQSLPDVQSLAMNVDTDASNGDARNEGGETFGSDNDSTSNLLMNEIDDDDDGDYGDDGKLEIMKAYPPKLTFTRASRSPSPTGDS